MMRSPANYRQAGSSLIVGMIMLVLLTLFVLSAISSGLINLRIASNTQARDEARAAAQQGIERVVSSLANFDPTPLAQATSNFSINNDSSGNYSVTVSSPVCTSASQQIPPRSTDCANGVASGVFCLDTQWEITATATDTRTGVSQTVTQGVAITFAPGSTPSLASGCQVP
jgi:Tfp pilus assembly protein PilX